MPDLFGLDTEAARRLLRTARLRPGVVRFAQSREFETGVVTAQDPGPPQRPVGSGGDEGGSDRLERYRPRGAGTDSMRRAQNGGPPTRGSSTPSGTASRRYGEGAHGLRCGRRMSTKQVSDGEI